MIVVIAKGIGRKISREWGNSKTMTKNGVNKPPSLCPFYQWAWIGAHPKEMLYQYQKPHIKMSEDFLGKTPFSGKMLIC